MHATEWLFDTQSAAAIGNHLWQSTLVLGLVWMFTIVLSDKRAAVRYRLWLAGALKFLVPFSAFVQLGRQFGSGIPTVTRTPLTDAVLLASQPFSQTTFVDSPTLVAPPVATDLPMATTAALLIWAAGFAMALLAWRLEWRRVADLASRAERCTAGPIVESIARVQTRLGFVGHVTPAECDTKTEPGVFGIWRPVLLWPRALTARLSEAEIDAIVAHELSHVHRRDNLAGFLYGLTRAVFWFHPAVWMVGRALHVERERACDEEVLRSGYAPRAYAEGIVKTCEFCVPTYALAAAGVSGNLTNRVVSIMRGHVGNVLGSVHRIVLTSVAISALMTPLAIGVITAPHLRAHAPAIAGGSPSFEVASVKPNLSADPARRFEALPGGRINLINLSAREIIFRAYQTQDHLIVGGPGWLNDDRFDVVAKAADDAAPQQMLPMVRTLLADRFKLVMHRETRELPIYNLVRARSDGRGAQPKATTCVEAARGGGVPVVRDAHGRFSCGVNLFGGGEVLLTGNTLDALANRLGSLPAVGRSVVNRTGLDGRFDIELMFTPGLSATPSADGVSLFTALEEQAGLKLEPARGPVEVLVIDSVERPGPD